MGTVIYRDGRPYEARVMFLQTPVECTLFYPLTGDPPDGGDTTEAAGGYHGVLVSHQGKRYGFYWYTHGRDTTPAFREEKEVARPKVRKGTELRWNGYRGCWQKFSRREKDWVSIEAAPRT